MNVAVNVLLPDILNNDPSACAPDSQHWKTLYLHHGVGANHADWIRKSNIESYAKQYGIAVVMPEVGRTWYTDTAYNLKYFTFVTQELPNVCRSYFKGMTDRREDNLVAGFSMGGYGALKAALSCPDRFCGCASLSGALDITRDGRTYLLEEWQSIFGFDLPNAAALKGTKHDIFALAEKTAHPAPNSPSCTCGAVQKILSSQQTENSASCLTISMWNTVMKNPKAPTPGSTGICTFSLR